MIQVYNYSTAMKIFKMLQDNEIVTLDIYTGEDCFGKYVINYTTVREYPSRERPSITKAFERNIITTLSAVTELKEFIEAMHTNSVLKFKMSYSILKPEIIVNKLYETQTEKTDDKFPEILDKLETVITELGIHNTALPCYEKVKAEGQKRPKYKQLEVCEVINILRTLEVCTDNGT